MPLHLYIEKHFQQNIHARQHGITMEIPPDEKTPKLESVEKDIITIGENEMPIYIYTPDPLKEGEEHYPLLIFFHGGTLIKGGIRSHDVSCRLLSILSGYKVIAVDYFSTPLSTSTVTNCYHITKWIVEHAQSFHGKQSDITIAGASIGATIATMIALHSIQTSEFHLNNQVLYYPLIDCNVQIEQSEFQSRKLYNGKYGVQLTTNDITIFQHIQPLLSQQITLEQMPNTLLFTAEYDPLCDEGEQYANLLKDSGATVKHVHFDGNIHGFMQYFPGSPDHIRGYQLTSEFLN